MFKINTILITGVLFCLLAFVGTLEAPREVCTADKCEII